jgi:hypothetical protein
VARVCNTPGCPNLTQGRLCRSCDRRSARNHGGMPRQAREHGAGYDRLAHELRGQPCALALPGCKRIATGADLIVPRAWGGRAVPENARPACSHCQSVQGGRMAAAALRAR